MRDVSKQKAVFWDRDGVVNEVVIDPDGYHRSPRALSELVLREGIQEAVEAARRLGYLNIVITNQPEVTRGLIARDELEKIHSFLQQSLHIDDVFTCLHDESDECECRKPKPGMLLNAAKKWNIDPGQSFMVGDRAKDVEAGKSAGVKTVILDMPYNSDVAADVRITSLQDLAQLL